MSPDEQLATTPPTEPAPVPTDAEGFDRWARDELDAWRLERVREVARAIWDDPDAHPAWRAVAGIWLAGEGGPPSEELLAAADAEHLPPFFAARLRAVTASQLAVEDRDRAKELLDVAVAETRDPAVDQRSRLAVLRTAAEVAMRAGRLGDAVAALDEARTLLGDAALVPGRDAAIIAAVQLDIFGLALADQRRQTGGDVEGRAKTVAALVDGTTRQARATAVLASGPPLPALISIRLGVGRVFIDLGLLVDAEAALSSVVEATEGLEPALLLRFQALLGLADVRLGTGGPEAALEVQHQAVELVRPLGTTPMLAWALRGTALQLRAAGRRDEAEEAFAQAVDLLGEVGQDLDAVLLQLDRARSLGDGERHDEAAAVLDQVLAVVAGDGELAGLADEQRLDVETRARALAAAVATARGEHDDAVDHQQRLAELVGDAGGAVADPRSAAAVALARAGRADEAEALFSQAEVDASDGPRAEYHLALVMGRRARVRSTDGEHEDAAELLRIAVNHARVAEDVVLLGRLSLELADAFLAAGQPGAAEEALRDARHEAATAGQADLVGLLDRRLEGLDAPA